MRDISIHMKRQFVAAVVLLLAATGVQAETLAHYPLEGSATSADTNAHTSASAIFVSGMTLGYATVGGQQGLDVTANPVSNGDYYAVTVSANPGFALDLNGGRFTLQDRTSSANTFSYSVFTSVDSYAAPLASFSLATANVWSSRTINLVGSSFEDLASITIRLVLSDNSSANSRHLYLDELRLESSVSPIVAVPEPGAVSLGLLAGIVLAVTRRRRADQAA